MGYVGNKAGPKKSIIVDKLGPQYFGISPQDLEVEIEDYQNEESRGVVNPVCVDDQGRYYLVFFAPGRKTQRFYLDENGCKLDGDILTEEDGKGC